MSSTNNRHRRARPLLRATALLALIGPGAMPFAALAQTAAGLVAGQPNLRGALPDPNAAPLAPPLARPDASLAGTIADEDAAGPAAAAGAPGAAPDSQAPASSAQKFPSPKTTARTRDRARPPRIGAPRLPDLAAFPTAVRRRGGGATIDTPESRTNAAPIERPGPTVAALPVEVRLRPRLSDDGFEPIGIEVGSLRLTPFIAQSFGYDSNPDQTRSGVKPSGFSRTEGGFGLLSAWSSNELRASIRGGYNDYFSDPGANRPDAIGTVDLRIDAQRDTIIDSELRFGIDTQRPGSPELNVNAVDRPLITTVGGSLGATQIFGRASLGLHGLIDRTDYENARLSDGSVQNLSDGNFTDYGVRLRGTYEITPVFRPFVDVLADRREHDNRVDLAGFRRDSDGVIAQLGTSFEIGRLISGEFSAGYGTRNYEDPRLRAIDGPVVNGAIAYAITPLTTLALKAATSFDETTYVGASGSRGRSVELDVTHELWRNLTLTGSVAYLNTEYQGAPINENTLSETLKAEYHLSRWLVATAAYNHAKLESSQAGSGFSQDVVLFGLRLQR